MRRRSMLGFAGPPLVALFGLAACAGPRVHVRPSVESEVMPFVEMPQGAFASETPGHQCRTSCAIPSASEATASSSPGVAAGLDPAMASLRGCLTSMGASDVDPVIFATYDRGGQLAFATIDLGGIAADGCIARARAVLPERTANATGLLRCSQRCAGGE